MNKKEIAHTLKDYPTALTVEEAAEILRVSTKTAYKLIHEAVLPALKVGRAFRIAKVEIINYLRQKDKQSSNPECVVFENSSDNVWTYVPSCSIVRVAKNKCMMKGMMANGKNLTCGKRTV